MNYRVLSVLFISLSLAFAGMGFVSGQDQSDDGKKAEGEEEAKDKEKEAEGEYEAEAEKEEEEKPKVLTKKEFHDLMEDDIKDNWNRLKFDHRKKMGERAATAAEKLKDAAPKMLQYDGEVLRGRKKGEKAREQKDFKGWVADFEKHLEDYAKAARKGDWKKADEYKDKINDTCSNCHDEYEPLPED